MRLTQGKGRHPRADDSSLTSIAPAEFRASSRCPATAVPAPADTPASAWTMAFLGFAALVLPAVSLAAFLMRAPPATGASPSNARERVPAESRAAPVEGRVLDGEATPVAGARVLLLPTRASDPAAMMTTDEGGRFAFDLGTIDKFKIRANAREGGFVESVELDASARGSVILVLPAMITVAGRVIDERGAPVPHARAKLTGGAPGSDQIVAVDGEGRYAFSPIGPGTRRLIAWSRGFSATSVDLPVDSRPITRDLKLHSAPAVSGTVTDSEGRAVALAHVIACADEDEEQALSDSIGHFELPPLVVGCLVRAHHPSFAASRPVLIVHGRGLTIPLEPGGSIEGMATDHRGRPIGSFSVSITSYDPAEGELSEGRVGESRDELRGAFRFDALAPGTYGIALSADTREPWSTTVRVTSGKVARGLHAVLGNSKATEEETSTVAGSSTSEPEPEPEGDTTMKE
jgi:hypothetical protein